MNECPECPTSPWAIPRDLKVGDVMKKTCCGREVIYEERK